MAKTGDIYTAVEELKDLAASAYGGLESNDDLLVLKDDLQKVIDKAVGVRSVTLNVIDALAELP